MEDREVLQGFLEEDKLVVEVATVREPVEGPGWENGEAIAGPLSGS